MEIGDYITFIQRRWLLLVVMPLIATVVAYAASQQLTPTYRAAATVLLINVAPPTDQVGPTAVPTALGSLRQDTAPQLNDIFIQERLTNTYLELVKRRPLLERVVQSLGLQISAEELGRKISATNQRNTQLIEIGAEDSSPALAADIANATVAAFISETNALIGRAGTVKVAEAAVPPNSPAKPNLKLNTAIAGILAFLLAIAIGLTLNYFSTTVPVQASPNSPAENAGLSRPSGASTSPASHR